MLPFTLQFFLESSTTHLVYNINFDIKIGFVNQQP